MSAAAATTHGIGVKGSNIFTTTGDPRVDLNVKLVRGASREEICAGLNAVIAAGHVEDAILMTFHARNVRGGKGERDVAAKMLTHLWSVEEEAVVRVLRLWPAFGSWRDLFAPMADQGRVFPYQRRVLVDIVAKQLEADRDVSDGGSVSLCAKWAPREHGSKMDRGIVRELAMRLFPTIETHPARMRAYRQLVAGLNRRAATIETLMCAGRWADIRPSAVPGRAGTLYGRAFLNLSSKKGHSDELRRPNDADRMVCRAHFQEHFAAAALGRAKINGADTVFPHEVVRKAYHRGDLLTADERAQMTGLWRAIVEATAAGGGLCRTVMMSDFSGSMRNAEHVGDTPYWVSMALGILGSQLTTGAFRGRMMTFDSTPRWFQFPEGADLFESLAVLRRFNGAQGLSTNFEAAMRLVLDTLRTGNVPAGEEPENLLVLTDMGWDAASSGRDRWETHVDRLREEFTAGGWRMPTIVIWNLAAQYSGDYHATADVPGVVMLSGWSAAQFRVLQQEVRQLTALEVLRTELDHPMYDPVRAALRDVEANHANGWGIEEDLANAFST